MKPLIVGPWLGEVGFELLYWIPFLRQALRRVPREQVYILTRGGCRSWYADLSPNYLELYDWYSPTEVARINEKRTAEQGAQGRMIGIRKGQRTAKQLYLSNVEADLVAMVGRKAGLGETDVLHPSAMYRAFRPYWRRGAMELLNFWAAATRLKRLTPPTAPPLPNRYVAVKFYASQANPELPAMHGLVRNLVRMLTDVTDVVLLHTSTRYDEHGEFPIEDHPRVHRLRFEPHTNLDQQTAIIAGARAYVGTYGGFAYLAPFLGVPTLALYGLRNFRRDHLRLMTHLARQQLNTTFEVTHLDNAAPFIRRHSRSWMAHAA